MLWCQRIGNWPILNEQYTGTSRSTYLEVWASRYRNKQRSCRLMSSDLVWDILQKKSQSKEYKTLLSSCFSFSCCVNTFYLLPVEMSIRSRLVAVQSSVSSPVARSDVPRIKICDQVTSDTDLIKWKINPDEFTRPRKGKNQCVEKWSVICLCPPSLWVWVCVCEEKWE